MAIKYHRPRFLSNSEIALDSNKFMEEFGKATFALGHLEGSQKNLLNPSLLISPLSAKEATVSSRIEGTISTVSDVYLYEAGGKPEHADAALVSNYRKTMWYAMEELMSGKEISHHIVQSLHSQLLSGVRSKGPLGQYRQDLVYIGKPDDPIEKATYIPPEFYLVREYMDDIIKYIKEGKKASLIKAGLIHYQFEAVHPFNDGNGRLGRLLVPLILYNEGTLSTPILYLSGFFDENRDAYLDALHEVDETGNYENWLSFFFRAVAVQAKETQDLIDRIYQLFEDTRNKYPNTKSPYLVPFIEFIFDRPVFTVQQIMKRLGVSYITAGRLVKMFQKSGDIQELSVRLGHSKLYEFGPLLVLLS